MYKYSTKHLANQIMRVRVLHKIEGNESMDEYLAQRFLKLNKQLGLTFDKFVQRELLQGDSDGIKNNDGMVFVQYEEWMDLKGQLLDVRKLVIVYNKTGEERLLNKCCRLCNKVIKSIDGVLN